MEVRTTRDETRRTTLRLMTITIAAMFLGALVEMAGNGAVWAISGIVAAIALFGAALQRRSRFYARR